jgi:predicted short-subunit dehydrogenase-like oxidoreductase (DUF2520 family)
LEKFTEILTETFPLPAPPSPLFEAVSDKTSKPLSGLRFSLIGPGKVGTSLASWLVAGGAQATEIAGGQNKCELARLLGGRPCAPQEVESGGLDLLLIAAPDHHLSDLAGILSLRPQAQVALHTAGCFDAEILAPLRSARTAVGSLHPLRAFTAPVLDPQVAHGTFFAWDGDPMAQDLARRLVTAWGGEGRTLTGESRVLYHLAASLAAGGVVTLLALAADLTERLGLPRQVLDGYFSLAENALDQAAAADHPSEAITGPAARGDLLTLARHRNALTDSAPEALELFDALTSMSHRQMENFQQNSTCLGKPKKPDRR